MKCFSTGDSPMLILIGRFSLLAASTSLPRTSITASFCLATSMVSHSDRAGDDLGGEGHRVKSRVTEQVNHHTHTHSHTHTHTHISLCSSNINGPFQTL